MASLDCLDSKLRMDCVWTLKRREASGLYVPVLTKRNVVTTYGKTALAGAWAGSYAPPQYIVIDDKYTTLNSGVTSGVSTTLVVPARVDIAGDTQVIIDPGLGSQETKTFTSVTGSGPFTYNLSGAVATTHALGAKVVRVLKAADDMSQVQNERQFDATNFPLQRLPVSSSYSTGTGNVVLQFYFTNTQANFWLMALGLSENQNVASGHLHNHIGLYFDNTAGTSDIEIDVSLTLS
jgi:hypothetical protein